jgi:hypothetical protein
VRGTENKIKKKNFIKKKQKKKKTLKKHTRTLKESVPV